MCCCFGHGIDPRNLKFLIKYVGYALGGIGSLFVLYGISFGILLPIASDYDNAYDAKIFAGTYLFMQGIGFICIAGLAYYIIVGVNNMFLKRIVLGSYICIGFLVYSSIAAVAFISLTVMSVHSAYTEDDKACLKGDLFK